MLGITVSGVEKGKGALVTKIAANSPFIKLMSAGDTIKKINGEEVTVNKDIEHLIAFSGRMVEFTLVRNGKESSVRL